MENEQERIELERQERQERLGTVGDRAAAHTGGMPAGGDEATNEQEVGKNPKPGTDATNRRDAVDPAARQSER